MNQDALAILRLAIDKGGYTARDYRGRLLAPYYGATFDTATDHLITLMSNLGNSARSDIRVMRLRTIVEEAAVHKLTAEQIELLMALLAEYSL